MQLMCPNCGETIPAERINIQQMAAVCPACDTVFKFDLPEPKSKRRKVKQPRNLMLRQDNLNLHLEFRTNFRLDKNESFMGSAVLSLVFTFLTILIIGRSSAPAVIPVTFILVALLAYYWMAQLVYNKTHIDMDDEQIQVSRRPLVNPFVPSNVVDLFGITAIRYEETPVSKKEGYDMPRYRVWAETADGRQKLIVNDMTEDYAIFIAQRLNEQLDAGSDPDTSRLTDEAENPDNSTLSDMLTRASKTDQR